MKVLTGASAVLSAAHHSKEGVLHGHTWSIRCWWLGKPDAVQKQAELRAYLASFDHSILPDDLAWGEALGARILNDLSCHQVEVSRPLEGIYAMIKETDQ